MSRRVALGFAVLCAVCSYVGYRLADSYIARLPNHAGYYVVAVPDQIQPQHRVPAVRPRHAVLVVVDGLRADYALAMHSVGRLRATGQCMLTDVGSESVSRPVYAVLSSGLEQDRTGARNNDEKSPLHVESIWQVAREAGLRVTAVSELPWFKQLFPDGFDSYRLVTRAEDPFATAEAELGALALIHPIYVDENGHEHGGKSRQYAAAASRADQELGRLLDRLDLDRDLVVFTADHGHTDRGGHGAHTAEVRRVLTCYSGYGIVRRTSQIPELEADRGSAKLFDSRVIAPSLAVLLQLRFPQNMRAGEDSLDAIWELVDSRVYPAAYLADRRAAVQHFRDANRAAVGHWLGRPGPAEWSELYAQAELRQAARGLLFLAAALGLCFILRRQVFPREPAFFVLWILATTALLVLTYSAARGSFDFNSVNASSEFKLWASIASCTAALAAIAAHWLRFRDLRALAVALVQLTGLVLLVNLAHIVAFGWPLGFPLPGRVLIFLPFIAGSFLFWQAGLACLMCLAAALQLSRARDSHR